MNRIEIRLLDGTRCSIDHSSGCAPILTDTPTEYGGGGSGFSSTDLVAAALGSCIGSSLAPLILREGIPIDKVRISVAKELRQHPRMIERLTVAVELPPGLSEPQVRKLRNATRACPVRRSLAPQTRVDIQVAAADHRTPVG